MPPHQQSIDDPNDPGFAPKDLSDGRSQGEWESRYRNRRARLGIWGEALYLGAFFAGIPPCIFILYVARWRLGLTDHQYRTVAHYGMAWLGGTLGGVLFSVKWLYHTVAHGYWNEDRRLWRIFTPHLSGGLAFGVMVMIDSGLIGLFDQKLADRTTAVLGLSFLVGYFSDSVVAKLAQVAGDLFGEDGDYRIRHRRGQPGDRVEDGGDSAGVEAEA